MDWVLIIVLVLLVVVLIMLASLARRNKFNKEMMRNSYLLHGETMNGPARAILDRGPAVRNPLEKLLIGTVYLFNAQQHNNAIEQFQKVLREIEQREVALDDANYIMERIHDFDEVADLDLDTQAALQQIIAMTFEKTREEKRRIIEILPDDPDAIQKTLLSRQSWHSDSQNVHDSNMYNMLAEQYSVVSRDVKESPTDAQDLVAFMRGCGSAGERVLDVARKSMVPRISNVSEFDLLLCVWRRSAHPSNASRTANIRKALAGAINDCVENNSVVCSSGRTKRIWQSLALLDFNPEIGLFKSKQVVRNEIYQKAAKIVDDVLLGVSDEVRAAYTSDSDSVEVSELKRRMIDEIENIKKDYDGFDMDQLTLVIEECKAVI